MRIDQLMNTSQQQSKDACWNYILELYSRRDVSDACLFLQDHAGVDVAFFLAIVYYATRKNVQFRSEDLERLSKVASRWQNDIIVPLRAVRRRVKTTQPLDDQTSHDIGLYSQMKSVEIAAEKAEVFSLIPLLEIMPAGGGRSDVNRTSGILQYIFMQIPRGHEIQKHAIEGAALSVLDAAKLVSI